MEKENYKYSELSEKIIGLAMKVHRKLGLGFPENIYHRALLFEFEQVSVPCESEKEQSVFYEGKLIGKRRVDFLVDEKILVEIQAQSVLDNVHYNQIQNYLQAFNLEVGLLINFGNQSIQVKRFVNKNYKPLS